MAVRAKQRSAIVHRRTAELDVVVKVSAVWRRRPRDSSGGDHWDQRIGLVDEIRSALVKRRT